VACEGAVPAPLREETPVKTLHTAYRVTDLAASLGFYSALGYREVGRVGMGEGGSLTMLKWPPGHPDGISAADFGRTP